MPRKRSDQALRIGRSPGRGPGPFSRRAPGFGPSPGFSSRCTKLARRNKALVAVAAAATLAACTLAVLSLHTRHTAARQAELVQRFHQRLGHTGAFSGQPSGSHCTTFGPPGRASTEPWGSWRAEPLASGPWPWDQGTQRWGGLPCPGGRAESPPAPRGSLDPRLPDPESGLCLRSLPGLRDHRVLEDCGKLAHRTGRGQCRREVERLYPSPFAVGAGETGNRHRCRSSGSLGCGKRELSTGTPPEAAQRWGACSSTRGVGEASRGLDPSATLQQGR